MALWKVFIDDSADQHRKEFVCAGVFFGRMPQWQKFQRRWNRVLRDKPRIKYFHGKELSDLSGEFAQFRDKDKWPKPSGSVAANAKRDALREVIAASDLIGFGLGLHIPIYEKIRASHPRAKTFMAKDAFEYILQFAIYETAKIIRDKIDGTAKVAFISDLSNKAPRYTQVYADWKKCNPKTARQMLGISHLDDEQWPGLQAADMAASLVKNVFELSLGKGEVPEEFPLSKRFYKICNINEDFHVEMLKNQTLRETEVDK